MWESKLYDYSLLFLFYTKSIQFLRLIIYIFSNVIALLCI